MGSSVERGTSPTIRALGSADDIEAASRLERMERAMPRTDERRAPNILARATNYLRSSGINPNPSFDDAMGFIEDQYQARLARGTVAANKVIDEEELSRTTKRRQRVAENAAMDRLLRGPLRPGRG